MLTESFSNAPTPLRPAAAVAPLGLDQEYSWGFLEQFRVLLGIIWAAASPVEKTCLIDPFSEFLRHP